MTTRSGNRVPIKGGSQTNPFEQIKINRSALFRRLQSQNEQAPLFETDRSGRAGIYVSGIVCFTKETQFPTEKIGQAGREVASWFHVMDLKSFSIPKEERMTLNPAQLSAIARYIHHSETEEWEKAASEPRPRKRQHQSDKSSSGEEGSKPDEGSGSLLGGSVALAYLGIGLSLWARWIAGFFSAVFDDSWEVGAYTGDSWLFGIADAWLAGGTFSAWSLV